MRHVQSYLTSEVLESSSSASASASAGLNASVGAFSKFVKFDQTGSQAASVIDALKIERLKGQVFAFVVTNQVVNFAQEVIVPWVLEGLEGMKAKGQLNLRTPKKVQKRVEFEDESTSASLSREDRAVLDAARTESVLPDYELFGMLDLEKWRRGEGLMLILGLAQVITPRWYHSLDTSCSGVLAGLSHLVRARSITSYAKSCY